MADEVNDQEGLTNGHQAEESPKSTKEIVEFSTNEDGTVLVTTTAVTEEEGEGQVSQYEQEPVIDSYSEEPEAPPAPEPEAFRDPSPPPPAEPEPEPLAPPPVIEQEQEEAPADNGDVADDRPVLELFVKAAVDKMKNGGCPTCHRYFLVFYVLRERGLIDLVVTTFLPENPPKEVLEISNGKHFPLIKVHKGIDGRGLDVTGMECDTVDEIEKLLDRFECDEMASSKESRAEGVAERSFEDLYKKFMVFIKDTNNNSSPLIRCLERIDAHLRDTDQPFMICDRLSRADCYLLPSLQHVRVAGKAYKDFEIPTELSYIWKYLQNAYDTDAFRESCPADREIITHYDGKASCRAKLPVRRSQLMGESRTFSIPSGVTNGTD